MPATARQAGTTPISHAARCATRRSCHRRSGWLPRARRRAHATTTGADRRCGRHQVGARQDRGSRGETGAERRTRGAAAGQDQGQRPPGSSRHVRHQLRGLAKHDRTRRQANRGHQSRGRAAKAPRQDERQPDGQAGEARDDQMDHVTTAGQLRGGSQKREPRGVGRDHRPARHGRTVAEWRERGLRRRPRRRRRQRKRHERTERQPLIRLRGIAGGIGAANRPRVVAQRHADDGDGDERGRRRSRPGGAGGSRLEAQPMGSQQGPATGQARQTCHRRFRARAAGPHSRARASAAASIRLASTCRTPIGRRTPSSRRR